MADIANLAGLVNLSLDDDVPSNSDGLLTFAHDDAPTGTTAYAGGGGDGGSSGTQHHLLAGGGRSVNSNAGQSGSQNAQHFVSLNSPDAQNRNVYVASLPTSFTDDNLRDLFTPYGPIVSCKMFNNDGRPGSNGRAYGFVMYADEGSVQRAIDALVGAVVGSQRIQVRRAKPNGRGPSAPNSSTPSPAVSGSGHSVGLIPAGYGQPTMMAAPMQSGVQYVSLAPSGGAQGGYIPVQPQQHLQPQPAYTLPNGQPAVLVPTQGANGQQQYMLVPASMMQQQMFAPMQHGQAPVGSTGGPQPLASGQPQQIAFMPGVYGVPPAQPGQQAAYYVR